MLQYEIPSSLPTAKALEIGFVLLLTDALKTREDSMEMISNPTIEGIVIRLLEQGVELVARRSWLVL
jgi:hypothetical protein